VTRGGGKYNEQRFISYCNGEAYIHNYYLKTLVLDEKVQMRIESMSRGGISSREFKSIANDIMREYDFIAITERFDESMVAMSMLLRGVTLGDFLYLSSKTAGGYDDGNSPAGCSKIQKSFVTPTMESYFNSSVWKEKIQWDQALWEAANASLDRTIDKVLGRTAFESRLQLYRDALKTVNERCGSVARYPCDPSSGKKRPISERNCLWNDAGCAFECIESVAKELNLYNGLRK